MALERTPDRNFCFGVVRGGTMAYIFCCPIAAVVFLAIGHPWWALVFIFVWLAALVLFLANEATRS